MRVQEFPVKVRLLGLIVVAFISLAEPTVNAQKPATAAAQKPKAFFKLAVKSTPLTVLSLKAKDAKLSDIAADLEKRFKVAVVVSQSLQKQTVSVEFEDLTLEQAVPLLAPQVFIDYELANQEQTPKAVFLSGYDDPQPSPSAVVTGSSQALLIEGDTEEGVEAASEEVKERLEQKPRVSFANNKLTVKAIQQPLVLIVLRIGDELGIPVEVRHETPEVISLELSGIPVEEAVQRVSPNVRLYVRADLQRNERRPLRLVLWAPEVETESGGIQPESPKSQP